MGLFNPLTFGRKVRTATNALLSSYTFLSLSAAEQNLVMQEAMAIAPFWFKGGWREKLSSPRERIVFLNLLAYGMMERGIRPALGDELWLTVKNPFVESMGAEELIGQIRKQLEAKHGVHIDLGDEGH